MITITQEIRTKAVRSFRNRPAGMIFPEKAQAIEFGRCPMLGCGKRVDELRNELSLKEYCISGMCQDCQDKTFGG